MLCMTTAYTKRWFVSAAPLPAHLDYCKEYIFNHMNHLKLL